MSSLYTGRQTIKNFNPRTYVRCDSIATAVLSSKRFQSTHLREVRLLIDMDLPMDLSFQSTHLREVRWSKRGR